MQCIAAYDVTRLKRKPIWHLNSIRGLDSASYSCVFNGLEHLPLHSDRVQHSKQKINTFVEHSNTFGIELELSL